MFKRAILIAVLLFVFLPLHAGAERLFLQPLPDGPSQREDHSAIYDSEHNEAIFFGGRRSLDSSLNDVWKLSLSSLSWTQVLPTGNIPKGRHSHAAIYDPVNRRMLVFGGTNPYYVYNDLYSLDLNAYTWSKLSPGGTLPLPRWNHTAIYNPTDSSMVVFGGRNPSTRFNDLWKLDLNTLTWTEITPVG